MKIALGPVLYAWPRERLEQFYDEVARSPVDIVYIGEVVCLRRGIRHEEWMHIADRLAQAGKEVVLSSLALLESNADLRSVHRIVDNGRYPIEANDIAAVAAASGSGVPFVAGPHLNVYNAPTLKWMAAMGANRWVMPVELSREAFMRIARSGDGMETEVLAFGRLPLAFSARCFTARACALEKDNCGVVCAQHPDGLVAGTREGQDLLVLNGIQTQSYAVYNLLGELASLKEAGVGVMRISPQSTGTFEAVALARRALESDGHESERLDAPGPFCNGYRHRQPGMSQV